MKRLMLFVGIVVLFVVSWAGFNQLLRDYDNIVKHDKVVQASKTADQFLDEVSLPRESLYGLSTNSKLVDLCTADFMQSIDWGQMISLDYYETGIQRSEESNIYYRDQDIRLGGYEPCHRYKCLLQSKDEIWLKTLILRDTDEDWKNVVHFRLIKLNGRWLIDDCNQIPNWKFTKEIIDHEINSNPKLALFRNYREKMVWGVLSVANKPERYRSLSISYDGRHLNCIQFNMLTLEYEAIKIDKFKVLANPDLFGGIY